MEGETTCAKLLVGAQKPVRVWQLTRDNWHEYRNESTEYYEAKLKGQKLNIIYKAMSQQTVDK